MRQTDAKAPPYQPKPSKTPKKDATPKKGTPKTKVGPETAHIQTKNEVPFASKAAAKVLGGAARAGKVLLFYTTICFCSGSCWFFECFVLFFNWSGLFQQFILFVRACCRVEDGGLEEVLWVSMA